MLDRASTFAQPEIVNLLKTRFIPTAIDQAYERRQQDTKGDFYRKIAAQSPRGDFNSTTQGFYIATASGELLLYNNNRDPEKVLRLMKQKLVEFAAIDQRGVSEIQATKIDPRFNVRPPEGGLVIRVHAKVLGGYEPTDDRWQRIFQTAMSRDNLWITKSEHEQLVRGVVPPSVQKRIAIFHLVDNTRGEPPMWKPEEIRELSISLNEGDISGNVRLKTSSGDRQFTAAFKGKLKTQGGRVTSLEMVCLGDFLGDGPFTRGAPIGYFPLGISFTLADGDDVADQVPPQGSRGWVEGYLR